MNNIDVTRKKYTPALPHDDGIGLAIGSFSYNFNSIIEYDKYPISPNNLQT